MKKIMHFVIEAVIVFVLIIYALVYRFAIFAPKDILDVMDWTYRLTVVPAFYLGISYGIGRLFFHFAVRKTNDKVCKIYLAIIAALFVLYVIGMLYTLWVLLGNGLGLSGYYNTIRYELFRIITKIGASRLQEVICILAGVLLAFGITGVQLGE